jgi:hypothetical protein
VAEALEHRIGQSSCLGTRTAGGSPSTGLSWGESLCRGPVFVSFLVPFFSTTEPKTRATTRTHFGGHATTLRRNRGHQAAPISRLPAQISSISGNGVLAVVQLYARSRSVPVSVPISLAVSISVSVSVSVSESVSVSAVVSVTASENP